MPNNAVKSVPKLRFPEFSDEWQPKRLGDFAKISKGKNVAKVDIVENGNVYAIRYGELYTKYTEVIDNVHSKTNLKPDDLVFSEINDVIIPASGESSIDIATASCVMKNGVALGGDLNIIRTKQNGIFLSYNLNNANKLEIAKMAQGNSVVHLYPSQINSLVISLPSIKEQEKIAGFLTVVDEKISVLEQKLKLIQKYKKGLMQQIFSQKLRFKDKNGNDYPAWQTKKLGELGKFKSGVGFSDSEQGGSTGIPFFKVSDMNLPTNSKIMRNANNYVSYEQVARNKYTPIQQQSIIFAKVGAAIFLERKRSAQNFLIDNNMMAFTPNESTNFAFIRLCFDTLRLSKMAQVGALPSYNGSDLALIMLRIPISIKEQEEIASFLNSIDEKIEAEERKLEKAKEFKKALLQQMFV